MNLKAQERKENLMKSEVIVPLLTIAALIVCALMFGSANLSFLGAVAVVVIGAVVAFVVGLCIIENS